MSRVKLLALVVSFVFFVASIFTLKDYGISWDEPLHFTRGQAYLHYFLTGKLDYKTLTGRRSYFQNNAQNGVFFLENDSAHPPASDILAASFNFIFYQKTGLVGDIEGYHLFNITISSVAVFVVTLFALEEFGIVAGLVSGFTLAFYPLFFAESHFNIKDPAETAFFTLTIWFFWKSLQKKNWKYLLYSSISCGLALGTKFNIVFLPFILVPYLFLRYFPRLKNIGGFIKSIPTPYKIGFIVFPFISIIVFALLWPYLWQDPISSFPAAIKYYQDIGTGASYQSEFLIWGKFNLYPIYWIVVTTPPVILTLTLLGIFSLLIKKLSRNKTEVLCLLWFLVPILRVSLPKMTIYGGVRQIMEFLPAMALLSGYGAKILFEYLQTKFKIKRIIIYFFFVALAIIPNLVILIKYHPNENVYFNFLVGGLRGAKEKDIPYWGNSFGNAYLQAVKWINLNVEKDAKLALVQGTSTNVPRIQLRSDINFSNSLWSGIERKGEYLLELTHNDPVKYYPYAWDYIDKFLEPVYEVKVDGVAIAKVWKNDILHTKVDMRKTEIRYLGQIDLNIEDNQLTIDLGSEQDVSRLVVKHLQRKDCSQTNGFIEIKKENGEWVREKEAIPFPQVSASVENNKFTYYFPGRVLSSLKFTSTTPDSCALINPSIEVYILK